MEDNSFEWLMDIEPVTKVTYDNARINMCVRLSPDSIFFHQTEPDEIGVVVKFSDSNDGSNNWVVVKFENINANSYRIGPYDFDLIMVD